MTIVGILELRRRFENPVSRLILEGRFGPKDVIPVDVRDEANGPVLSFEGVVH